MVAVGVGCGAGAFLVVGIGSTGVIGCGFVAVGGSGGKAVSGDDAEGLFCDIQSSRNPLFLSAALAGSGSGSMSSSNISGAGFDNDVSLDGDLAEAFALLAAFQRSLISFSTSARVLAYLVAE